MITSARTIRYASEREPKLVGYLARPDAGLSALAGGDKHEANLTWPIRPCVLRFSQCK